MNYGTFAESESKRDRNFRNTQILNLVAQHEDVISLTIGQPDFSHRIMWKLPQKAIDENVTSYTPNAGYLELRQAVQLYMKKKRISTMMLNLKLSSQQAQAKPLMLHSGRFYLPVMKSLCQGLFIRAMNLLSICAGPSLSLLILRHTALSLPPGWLKMLWHPTPSVSCFLIRQTLPAWLYLKKNWKASQLS